MKRLFENKMALTISIFLLIQFSCKNQEKEKKNDFNQIHFFYEQVKDRDLSLLMYKGLWPRGQVNDSTYNLSYIYVYFPSEFHVLLETDTTYSDFVNYKIQYFNESNYILLPAIRPEMNDSYIKSHLEVDFMSLYGQLMNFPDSVSYGKTKEYSMKIVKLFDELSRIAPVDISSWPKLGEFITFSMNPSYDLIYVPDTSKVRTQYWKIFFNSKNKFDDKWYYEEKVSSGNKKKSL